MTEGQVHNAISEACHGTPADAASSAFIDMAYFLMTGKNYPLATRAHNTYTKELNKQ